MREEYLIMLDTYLINVNGAMLRMSAVLWYKYLVGP